MPPIPQGQPDTISTEVRLAPVPPATIGVLATPTTILLRLKKPDGTFVVPDYTPVADAVGKYHVDIPGADLSVLGQYRWAWYTTGTAGGVSPRAGIINVVDPFAPAHISYEDAKARLNLSATYDAEVQAMVDSAVSEQERRVGAVAPRTVTEVVSGWPGHHGYGSSYGYGSGGWGPYGHPGYLMLGQQKPTEQLPVLSVTSATLNGSSVDVSQWFVENGLAGMVRPSVSWPFGPSATGFTFGTYTVTYVAGRNPVPQDLVEAALLRVQHSYATQRGASGGGGQIIGAGSSDVASGGADPSDFLLVLRAQDKERPYMIPSIA